MITRGLAALALAPLLLASCSSGTSTPTPDVAASAPLPGVTLPPDALTALVPTPADVPAGMVPLLTGSGVRTLAAVAAYSGTGDAATKAAAKLTQHGFTKAYVAQYANQATAQSVTVLVSEFATAAGAKADLTDDLSGSSGKTVAGAVIGEQSQVTIQDVASIAGQLVLARFRDGAHTWLLSYTASPTADPSLAFTLAKTLVARAS